MGWRSGRRRPALAVALLGVAFAGLVSGAHSTTAVVLRLAGKCSLREALGDRDARLLGAMRTLLTPGHPEFEGSP